MKLSTKPRHWITLAVAVALLIVAIISFADFSGEPAPRWREIVMLVGPILMVVLIVLNMSLDQRDKGPGD